MRCVSRCKFLRKFSDTRLAPVHETFSRVTIGMDPSYAGLYSGQPNEENNKAWDNLVRREIPPEREYMQENLQTDSDISCHV